MYSKMVFVAFIVASICLLTGSSVAAARHLPNAYLLPADNVYVPGFSEVKRFRSEPIRFGKRATFREPVRFGKRSSWNSLFDQEFPESSE